MFVPKVMKERKHPHLRARTGRTASPSVTTANRSPTSLFSPHIAHIHYHSQDHSPSQRLRECHSCTSDPFAILSIGCRTLVEVAACLRVLGCMCSEEKRQHLHLCRRDGFVAWTCRRERNLTRQHIAEGTARIHFK